MAVDSTVKIPPRRWPGDEPAPLPHPAPEVEARIAEALEIPRNAAKLAALAVANGWVVRIMYARGTWPGRELRVVDSITLRCRRDHVRAAGVWLDWRFHSGHVWGDGSLVPRMVSMTELHAIIESVQP